jgi:hypothetical protein
MTPFRHTRGATVTAAHIRSKDHMYAKTTRRREVGAIMWYDACTVMPSRFDLRLPVKQQRLGEAGPYRAPVTDDLSFLSVSRVEATDTVLQLRLRR